VFFATVGKQDSYVPKLDDVRDRVREDAVRERAAELARSRAREIAPALGGDFAKAARDAGLDVKSTELVTRGSMLPEVGSSPAVDAAVFDLPQGGVSDPIDTPAGTVVARVVERQDVDRAAMAAAKDELRRELVGAQRARFFEAYMRKAQERLQTRIAQDVVQSAAGM
jgi:parvulin-like peptidyl-prolyl isomerase